ncbi:MAG: histidine kinase [Gemmatimonadaceae bacterium]
MSDVASPPGRHLFDTSKPGAPSGFPRWLTGLLGIPLELKLVGANLLVVSAVVVMFWGPFLQPLPSRAAFVLVVIAGLALGLGMNFYLVRIALRPIALLERAAVSVSSGRLSERVPASLVADSALAHLADTFNQMLATLAAGRQRMQQLCAEVVYAQERERAQIGRDLHDSLGQTLAAASFQVAALVTSLHETSTATSLAEVQELLRTAVEETRNVSRALHPRVADDLGLLTALEGLARSTSQRSLIDVTVTADVDGGYIPAPMKGTLYRIAQEALRHVESHAGAGFASVALKVRDGTVKLSISDDGTDFPLPAGAANLRFSLAPLRERLSLAGGELEIETGSTGGTRVLATVRTDLEAA